jgi:hypothetical protein
MLRKHTGVAPVVPPPQAKLVPHVWATTGSHHGLHASSRRRGASRRAWLVLRNSPRPAAGRPLARCGGPGAVRQAGRGIGSCVHTRWRCVRGPAVPAWACWAQCRPSRGGVWEMAPLGAGRSATPVPAAEWMSPAVCCRGRLSGHAATCHQNLSRTPAVCRPWFCFRRCLVRQGPSSARTRVGS